MADESVGYYWNQAAKERETMERHDREHPGDPKQWWQDCEICAERVCEYCNNTGYCKSNTAEYEGPCPKCSTCSACGLLKECLDLEYLCQCESRMQLEIDKAIDNDIEHARHGI